MMQRSRGVSLLRCCGTLREIKRERENVGLGIKMVVWGLWYRDGDEEGICEIKIFVLI